MFLGTYIPSCDEDGYYRKVQCDQSRGECWCVDLHGEMMGSRIHGNPDCGKAMAIWKVYFFYFYLLLLTLNDFFKKTDIIIYCQIICTQ